METEKSINFQSNCAWLGKNILAISNCAKPELIGFKNTIEQRIVDEK
jgi:hypothetical protein